MSFKLSRFGQKLSGQSGITELMTDLGEAMAGHHHILMMGGGNPAMIPDMADVWRRRMQEIMAEGHAFDHMLANYDSPQGRREFIDALIHSLNGRYGWDLKPENIAITNGSQNAFFYLFNMLAGEFDDGTKKKILLPLTPEYIGYADQGIDPDLFTSFRPTIEHIDKHTFKYHIDFSRLTISDDVSAICVSRPTNPTGNVLTNQEIDRLADMARGRGIPLIIDNAYGAPFPDIIFTDAQPRWDENIILALSLSKLGLPGARTGIVIAREEIARALSCVNAIVSLANGNIGQAIVSPLLRNGELLRLSKEIIRPFYQRKSLQAIEWVHEAFADSIPYRIHKSEGALFLWLWFPDLPITAKELYSRLKKRNLLVIPGDYFFYGLGEEWSHRHECVRITYSQADRVVHEGIGILAEEVKRAFAG